MQLLSSSSFFYSSRTAARLCSACELLRSPFVRVHAHPMQNVLNSGECCVMSLWGKKLYYNIQGSFAFSIFNFKVFRDLKHVETIFWFSSFIVDTAFESQISFQSLNLLLEGWQIAIICLAVNCSLKYICSQCTDRQAKQWQNHFGKVFFFKVRSVQNSRKGCDYFASLLALSNIQFEAWFMARVGAFFARVFLDFFLKMFVANYVASFRRLNSKEHNSHQLFLRAWWIWRQNVCESRKIRSFKRSTFQLT